MIVEIYNENGKCIKETSILPKNRKQPNATYGSSKQRKKVRTAKQMHLCYILILTHTIVPNQDFVRGIRCLLRHCLFQRSL